MMTRGSEDLDKPPTLPASATLVGSIPASDLTSTVIRRPASTCLPGNFLAGLLTVIAVLGQMT
jgi:hypothetical protein